MLQCGFVRSNFAFAMTGSPALRASLRPGAAREPNTPLSLGVLRLDLVSHVARHLRVVRELHRVHGAPLAHRPQLADVTEHVGERHEGTDDSGVAAHLLVADLTAPAVDV